MTVQCCKCKRVRVGDAWTFPQGRPDGPVSHSYCPSCADLFLIEIFSSQASRATGATIRSAAEAVARAAVSA